MFFLIFCLIPKEVSSHLGPIYAAQYSNPYGAALICPKVNTKITLIISMQGVFYARLGTLWKTIKLNWFYRPEDSLFKTYVDFLEQLYIASPKAWKLSKNAF